MNFDQLIELIVIVTVVALPALALTVRLALKPIVEAVIRLTETVNTPLPRSRDALGAETLLSLQEELEELRNRVAGLEQVDSFHRELGQTTTRQGTEAISSGAEGSRATG